ncbi:hypothetical protein Rsub_07947 [Raphidocelis subcapitata]|uniref:Diphthine--ammonia ligase n=1 Tax=Raphidocelis subcapitata TaxID=307507 RepID=A0A2V0P8G6_9CHLO|nr:hypothetical protein Rsub_07947 [Raphidocelis subcapitata]|eukprot:GBF95232.1 hypothetical protein Rsub_07947 [Raphidocelis subcapitata]
MADARRVQRRRCWLSWSSGKDCCYALKVLREDPSVAVVGLMTSINESADRVAMHGVRARLLQEQADAVGLPVYQIQLPSPCSNEDYEVAMRGALEAAKEAGVEVVAFGDIHLADVRAYREERMAGTGIDTLFPLWGRDTAELARAIINAGIEAILTCVDATKLPPHFAGRRFDAQLLADLPPGVDPCGEGGEFHTLVVSAAGLFDRPLDVLDVLDPRLRVRRGNFVFMDVVPADVDPEDAARDAEKARREAAAADAAAEAAAAAEPAACVGSGAGGGGGGGALDRIHARASGTTK